MNTLHTKYNMNIKVKVWNYQPSNVGIVVLNEWTMNGVWFSYFTKMPSLPALRSNGLCQENQNFDTLRKSDPF